MIPNHLSGFVSSPGLPFRAQALWGELRARLSQPIGRELTAEQMARRIGKSVSTTHFWLTTYTHPQLLSFIALLEWLAPAEREGLLGGFCRHRPTLWDPWILSTPGDRALVLTLLRQKQGLTIITGGDDRDRTTLVTALGHSYCQLSSHRWYPAGIDIHLPKRFVPVSEIKYLSETNDPTRMRWLILENWPKLVTTGARLLLFNRVWATVPAVRADLLRLARSRHVMLADDETDLQGAVTSGGPLYHCIGVSPGRETAGGLQSAVLKFRILRNRLPQA